ncbi:sensor histidine kinase [uncultured Pseudoteredinibacter sp.]|uniref:sensor histidine kinase n=1 Tax=uncultured Pseudoteredinibacter sp. TaxID=1641701 RepID=UPI00261665E1|nr:sensor histidine kinase [uncultured Pseudoteredinibacter sp.]
MLISISLLACNYVQASKDADIFDLGSPYFETVLEGNYELPTITDLAQGKNGLIWIATYEGLYQYDGYQVIPAPYYNHSDEKLPSHWVRKVAIAQDGKIWMGTAASGLYVLNPNNRSYQHFSFKSDTQSSNPSINEIIPLDTEQAWIGSSNGVCKFHLKKGKLLSFNSTVKEGQSASGKQQLLSATVVSALLLDGDTLWVGSTAGIDKLNLKESSIVAAHHNSPSDKLSQQTLTKIFKSKNGSYWFGTFGKGAYRKTATGDFEKLNSNDWIKDIIQLPNGNIWMSSARSGILIFDEHSGEQIGSHRHSQSSDASFDSNNAGAFLLDQSGLLWISTLGKGLSRINIGNNFSRSLAHNPEDPHSLSHNDIYAIYEDSQNQLWFSTYGKGVDVFNPSKGKIARIMPAIGQAGALQEGTIKAITEDRSGNIWLGGLNRGLYRIKNSEKPNGQLEQFTTTDGLYSNKIFRLFPEANGDLLVLTRRGLNRFIKNDQRLEKISDSEFSKTAALYYKAYMDNGDLWLGGPSTLFYLASGAKELQKVELKGELAQHLTDQRILALHRQSDSEVILISQSAWYRLSIEAGSIELNAERIFGDHFSNVESFPGPDGRYWGANFVFDFQQGKTQLLNRADGVFHRIRRPMASVKTRSGNFIFGGANGISILKPAQYHYSKYQPPLIINRIDIDGRELLKPGSEIDLAANDHGFSVSFAALDYADPLRTQYAYRLEGYDEQWIPSDANRRLATYTNLSPGQYELQIRASNRAGEWSSHSLAIPINISAAWYETLWFKVLALAVIALVIYILFHFRVRHLQNRKRILENEVSLRTEELRDSLDNLRSTQEQLVASEKHASLGRLVRGMAHELNTPLGVVSMAHSVISDCSKQSIAALPTEANDSKNALSRKLNGAESLMHNNLQRLNQLISNFKLLAGDEQEEQDKAIRLYPLIEKVVAQMQAQFIAAKVRLFIEGPEDLQIRCKESALFHVLKELLQNALEHAFDKQQSNAEIHIEYQLTEKLLEVSVKDNGIGLSEELLSTAFDPFVAAKAHHVGLGLHAAFNNSSQQLGGHLHCQNQESGCCFTLQIPVQ